MEILKDEKVTLKSKFQKFKFLWVWECQNQLIPWYSCYLTQFVAKRRRKKTNDRQPDQETSPKIKLTKIYL